MIATKSASQAVLEKGAQQCEKFGEIYPVLFPKESITRKMHVLICILPIYIRLGSVYKFMKIEQKSENLHCIFNGLERRFKCVCPKQYRYFSMLQEHENRMKTDFSLFNVTKQMKKDK